MRRPLLVLLLLTLLVTSCSTTTSSFRWPTFDASFPRAQAALVDARYFAARSEVDGFVRLVDPSGIEFARVDVQAGFLVVADLREGVRETVAPGDPVPPWAVAVVARLDALRTVTP